MKTLFLLLVIGLSEMACPNEAIVVMDASKKGSSARVFFPIPEIDTNKALQPTPHFIGKGPTHWDTARIKTMESGCVSWNLTRAEKAFDVTSFPIRTSVAIFYPEDGKWKFHGSGSLISPRHVLTAAHNIQFESRWWGEDSLLVVPAYDDGRVNPQFGSTISKRYYYMTTGPQSCCYGRYKKDFGVLELRDPIGDRTGWLGYGSNMNPAGKILHTFTYPAKPKSDSSRLFNGDTLFYTQFNGCLPWGNNFIPGQSGGNIFTISNGQYAIFWNWSTGSQAIDFKTLAFINFAVADSARHTNSNSIIIRRSTSRLSSTFNIYPFGTHLDALGRKQPSSSLYIRYPSGQRLLWVNR